MRLASRARATHVNPFCTPEEAEAVVELAQEFGDFHQQNDVGATLKADVKAIMQISKSDERQRAMA